MTQKTAISNIQEGDFGPVIMYFFQKAQDIEPTIFTELKTLLNTWSPLLETGNQNQDLFNGGKFSVHFEQWLEENDLPIWDEEENA